MTPLLAPDPRLGWAGRITARRQARIESRLLLLWCVLMGIVMGWIYAGGTR